MMGTAVTANIVLSNRCVLDVAAVCRLLPVVRQEPLLSPLLLVASWTGSSRTQTRNPLNLWRTQVRVGFFVSFLTIKNKQVQVIVYVHVTADGGNFS